MSLAEDAPAPNMTNKMRQTLEYRINTINAIVARDGGLPYTEVLERYGILPIQFYKAVHRAVIKPRSFGLPVDKDTQQILEEIRSSTDRQSELFRMEEELIQNEYDKTFGRVVEKPQKKVPPGTMMHPQNRVFLVYHAINSSNPELKSAIENNDRMEVIYLIRKMPKHLTNYFYNLALGALMNNTSYILELFDTGYQQKTGDVSLFNLSHRLHLHKWHENFNAPRHYWKNPSNVEEAVYHTLTENHPELLSNERREIIREILLFPDSLYSHFQALGLAGLMGSGLNNSSRAILEVFDKVYQRERNEHSLFDRKQEHHIEFDGNNRLIRKLTKSRRKKQSTIG